MDNPTTENQSDSTAIKRFSFSSSIFTLQPVTTTSDQSSQPTATTCTSPSAATPRNSHLLTPGPANLVDAAVAPSILDGKEPTGDVGQLLDSIGSMAEPQLKQSSQLDSTLLSRLPRELRDKIWREAVLEDIEIPTNVAHYETKDGEHRHRLQLEHALMLACKQTRHEVTEIYYLENTFRITNDLFEARAIRALNRALHPWADKMTKLEISHEYAINEHATAEIDFTVSTSQGRIVIEPLTFSVNRGNVRPILSSSSPGMCFCSAFRLASAHGDGNVFSWVQEYVDFVATKEPVAKERVTCIYAPYCWTCAGRIIV